MRREETGISGRSYLDWVEYQGYWKKVEAAGRTRLNERKSSDPISAKPMKSCDAASLDAAYLAWREKVVVAFRAIDPVTFNVTARTLRSNQEMRRLLASRGYPR
jgi:hypothetical protein